MLNFIFKKHEQTQIYQVNIKIIRYSLININAESIGIKTLDNEIIDYLNTELEEKIKSILSVRFEYLIWSTKQAKKFMRVSKRKTLKVDDLNHSLKFFNFKVTWHFIN